MSFSPLKTYGALPGLHLLHSGKVRDTYIAEGEFDAWLLIVATDRVSTHNVKHKSLIPDKGYVLTAMTIFWMADQLKGIKTHLVASGENIYQHPMLQLHPGPYPKDLHRRAIIVRRLDMAPVEFIFRNRMVGSLWKDYYSKGLPDPYGIDLPTGLSFMTPFDFPIFTPTDKSETDDPLSSATVMQQFPDSYELALRAHEMGRAYALTRGIEIIDGKFELGWDCCGDTVLGDEVLTPDSCRFVEADKIIVGQEPPWLDKQYLRDEVTQVCGKGPVTPQDFSPQVIEETARRYRLIFERLTGQPLEQFLLDRS